MGGALRARGPPGPHRIRRPGSSCPPARVWLLGRVVAQSWAGAGIGAAEVGSLQCEEKPGGLGSGSGGAPIAQGVVTR